MPLSKELAGRSFDPEALRVITAAFEQACAALKLTSKPGRSLSNKLLAKKVIEAAEEGERDPSRLCERVLGGLQAS